MLRLLKAPCLSTVVMAKVSSVQLTDAPVVVAAVMDAVEVVAMAVVMVVIK